MKSDEAGAEFESGYNCAQSVLIPFAADFGLSRDEACRMASVFGAGMGRMQETCGAVTGAFMVLGLKYGYVQPKDPGRREDVLRVSRDFVGRFKERFGAIRCRDLLGCDLNTAEGRRFHAEEGQRELICAPCVRGAAGMLEDMLDGAPKH
jgi:C_GCAxxG_C_C family probable redox protein